MLDDLNRQDGVTSAAGFVVGARCVHGFAFAFAFAFVVWQTFQPTG